MKSKWFSILCIIASVLIGVWAFPQMPNEVAIHWGPNGEADGFGSKWFGAFMLPALLLVLWGLKVLLPKIDPRREKYKEFSKSYHITMDAVLLFLFAMHVVTVLINLGYDLKIDVIVMLLLGLLFMVLGNYLPKVKHNYFMGIRNPWTLANENVWNKTHRFSGKIFMITGMLVVISVFASLPMMVVIVAMVVFLLVPTTIVSYLYHKKENH